MKGSFSFITCLILVVFLPTLGQAQRNRQKEKDKRERLEQQQQEEQEDYYKKWLKEDVVYIIQEEEEDVFTGLTTPEEKEQFIEQFWYRRDLDLTTAINEFKEEHYRRIAYANERFASGLPGWMTDRGRIYIMHGKPDELESHPSGGTYQRPFYEGGGTTSTFPFEKWWYRYIEGVGSDIELEFVDPTFSGEYRLALYPEEKDALLHIPGAGLTMAEEMGMSTKADRPYFNPGSYEARQYTIMRQKDQPFQRYETYTYVQRPPTIKYKDLKEIVNINITYSNLPFKIRKDYFRLNEHQVLVPITLEFQNKELTYKKQGGVHVAKVAIYGIITSITNRIIKEFEDDVLSSYQPEYLEQGLQLRSIYQKVLPLDRKMRYKLDLVVKDLNSGKVGVTRQAIIPPPYNEDKFSASSLILSERIQPLAHIPKQDEMFVLGDVKVLPSLGKVFPQQKPLGVYLQLYNAGFDQTTLTPSLRVSYKLLRGGDTIIEVVDESGESVQYFSGRRVVLIKSLPTQNLEPGKYRITVEVQDRIKNQVVTATDDFQITAPTQLAANR